MRGAIRSAGPSGVLLALALGGCSGSFLTSLGRDGGSDATPSPHDDASLADTGARRDTGGATDTGSRRDVALPDDAAPIDAQPSDTGPPDAHQALDSGTKHDAEVDAARDAGHDAGPSSPCPANVQTAGATCTVNSLACEYGSDPDLDCDTVMTCETLKWVETVTPDPSSCSTVNGNACPATLAQVPVGSSCTSSVSCYYPDARCECASHLPEINLVWSCDIPSGTTSCPIPRPRLGSVCTMPNEECDYGACQGGFNMTCTGGIWVQTQSICPG